MFTKIYEKMKEFIKENYKSLIGIVIIYLLFAIELPYAIYTPGGAVNLNDRIKVDNGYKSDGSFNMAYVSMVKGSLPFILMAKVIPDWDIVDKDELTIEGEDMKELVKRERLYLQESIDAAVVNAYLQAHKEIDIKKVNNNVGYITEEAKTNLEVGDIIVEADDNKITSLIDLQNVVQDKKEGEKVSLEILRNGKEKDAYATVYATDDGLKIGVSFINTYEYEVVPKVEVKSKASEMGSSGGLMMSLTIYNQLTEEDLTKGKKIVGTGTIDIEGNVGEIAGVKYKLIGAVKKKAEIFICPEENYEEAVKIKEDKGYDITIIKAHTFSEVLEKLAEI